MHLLVNLTIKLVML